MVPRATFGQPSQSSSLAGIRPLHLGNEQPATYKISTLGVDRQINRQLNSRVWVYVHC